MIDIRSKITDIWNNIKEFIRVHDLLNIKKDLIAIKDLILENKKRSAVAAAVICGIVIALIIAGNMAGKNTDDYIKDSDQRNVADQDIQSQPSLIARIGKNKYLVYEKKGKQYLYKNGKQQKEVKMSNIQAMEFNLDSAGNTTDIKKYADSAKTGKTGSSIYRGETYIWEQYLAHLKDAGYCMTDYIKTGSYTDIYLRKADRRYRYLIIKKTDTDSVLLFTEYNGRAPGLPL